jgi:predicted ATPase
MGQMAVRTIFDFFFARVLKMAAALIAQKIQRAIAEQAVKTAALWRGMAGEIFTRAIVKEFVTVFQLFSIPAKLHGVQFRLF